jgi:hypothetical protein
MNLERCSGRSFSGRCSRGASYRTLSVCLPCHFVPEEISLKFMIPLKALEGHAIRSGLAVQDLKAFLLLTVRNSFH